MIVVLDSTVLVSDPLLRGVPWKILAHAARRLGVRLCITEVVLQEATAKYSRRIDDAVVGFERWGAKHSSALGMQSLVAGVRQELLEHAASYGEQLRSLLDAIPVEVLPIPDVEHQVLVQRATSRVRPCKQTGDGYRDTLNWFSLLALARERETSVIWVSDDGDFAAEDGSDLHPELRAELNGLGLLGRITLFRSVHDVALTVASQFGNADEDLRKIQDRLTKDALTNYVRTELLADLPSVGGFPVLSELGDITDADIEVKAALDGEEAAVEVAFTCNTTILVDTSRESTTPVHFTALLTVDHYYRPTGGEITSIDALDGDPSFAAFAAVANGDQMVSFLVKKKDGSIPAELDNPVVFTKDYVKHRLLSKTTYEQGTSGLVTKVHAGLFGGITHVDVRLPDGVFLREVPIDYFTA